MASDELKNHLEQKWAREKEMSLEELVDDSKNEERVTL